MTQTYDAIVIGTGHGYPPPFVLSRVSAYRRFEVSPVAIQPSQEERITRILIVEGLGGLEPPTNDYVVRNAILHYSLSGEGVLSSRSPAANVHWTFGLAHPLL